MKKYKILIIIFDIIDENAGGVQSIVKSLSNLFIKKGFDVKYLLYSENTIEDNNYQYFHFSPVYLKNQNEEKRLIDFFNINEFDFIINNFGLNFQLVIERLSEIRKSEKLNFKIINYHHNGVQDVFDSYENITLNKFDSFSSISYKIQKYLFLNLPWFRKFYLIAGKQKLLRNFRNACLYSEANIFHFDNFANEAKNKLEIPSHVLNTSVFPPIKYKFNPIETFEKENIVLYVGRVELMQKRIDKLLQIWKAMGNASSHWKLFIVGEGSYIYEAKAFVSKFDLNNVFFLGKDDPEKYYRKSKLLLLTSDFEGLGLVLVESMMKRCIPVSFKCYSGITQIISNNQNGILIEKGNDVEFATKLQDLLEHPEKIDVMNQEIYSTLDSFNDDFILNKWLEIFEKLEIGVTC